MKGDTDEAVAAGAHAMFLCHGLGHMMCMDVHDMEIFDQINVGFDEETIPNLEQCCTYCLRLGRRVDEGFVVTDEPGIYFIPALIDDWRSKGLHKDFINNVKDGDIMVGGWNFGCGSSREHAPLAIKTAGISVVIAKSFARIFYRNSINIGLPIMECPEAVDAISAGDTVSVDFDTGVITDETTGKTFQAEPFPPFIQKIIADGGLMKSLTKK